MMKIKTQLIKSLTEFFNTKMEEYGNKDFLIDNIRLSVDLEGDTEKISAFADAKYKWYLHGHEKNVEHKDMIFVYIKGQWHSPSLF